jgi:adenine-specific DNA-methyltransferase
MTAIAPYTVGGDETRKARGAFYTPTAIADFLVSWAVRSGSDSVLEPSCGEAAFLSSVINRLRSLSLFLEDHQIVGVEIHPDALANAGALIRASGVPAQLHVSDFFAFRTDKQFDAVVGNPPYVRYQTFAGASRTVAQEAALRLGVRIAGLANSWAPFVVHATSFLKPTGRLALVLPAELLSVNYAAPVRRFLMERFRTVRLVLFEERVFPGVLEEVVLLLAEGQGPTDHCELVQAKNLENLSALKPHTWSPTDAEGKWTAGLVPSGAEQVYARILAEGVFEDLQAWGETDLGMVTGNNRYFTLTVARVKELKLRAPELVKICPARSKHLRGLNFTESAWEEMVREGAAGYLFDPPTDRPSEQALAYIKQGERERVNEAYKCRVRSPWWKVPKVGVPDAFLTYMNHDTPRLVTNRAGMSYLNSVHGVTFADERRSLAMDLLPIAMLNSVTLLGAEIVGRAYGGGLLKIEPKEADRLPVPSFGLVKSVESELRNVRPQLGKYLRGGNLRAAVRTVDRVLRAHMRIQSKELAHVWAGREFLFQRRATRARSDL